MKKSGRGREPYLPPVRRIELPPMNTKLRWIAIAVLIVIAAAAFARGISALTGTDPGWQTVEAVSEQPNCSREFAFQYDMGGSTVQMRQLKEIYTKACEESFEIFTVEAENIGANEPVTVSPALYKALSVFDEKTQRFLFLAPAYQEYARVFLCQDDGEAARYDPAHNAETAQWLAQLTAYTNDPAHVSLELLGGNQVRLNVSPEYLRFAQENGIETFLDFGWMKNAFIADYLAEVLTDNGFTAGYLASYDGFTRNLDQRDYSVNLFDRQGSDLYAPARFDYSGPMSLVFLRDYPVSGQDRWHYYAYENGEILTTFLDPADAMSKASIPTLLGCAPDKTCAQILMELLPVFVSDHFDPQPLGQTAQALWFQNATLHHTDPAAALTLLENTGGADYHIQ